MKHLAKALLFTAILLPLSPVQAASNPMDSVGVEHNVYLGCLMRPESDKTVSVLRRLVIECGYRPGMSVDEFESRYSRYIGIDSKLSIVARMDPYRSLYTTYQFSYFTRLDQLFATATSSAQLDAGIASLESEAVRRLAGGSAAENSVLATLSTARHSLRYWTSTTGVYGETANPAARIKVNWGRVLEVCAADLIAGGIGTLIGGPVLGGALGAGASAAV